MSTGVSLLRTAQSLLTGRTITLQRSIEAEELGKHPRNLRCEDHVISQEGVVTSFCDPETYLTPVEVCAITSQGCYVVVGLHLKKEASEQNWETLHNLM